MLKKKKEGGKKKKMQKRLGQLTKEGKVGSHSTGTQASSDLRWRTE